MAKPICAITGAGGYLGSCLRKHFEQNGWEVRALTRAPKAGSGAVAFQLGEEVAPASLQGVHALVHCAYDFSAVRWKEIHAKNVEGTRKLLDAARKAGVPKIAVVSTISAFEGCRSLYGKAKLEIERMALANGLLVLRPGLIYGNGAGGMVGKLIGQLRKTSLLPLVGGEVNQYLVHEDDLCDFIRRYAAGTVLAPPLPLIAAHPEPWRFRAILEALAGCMGKRVRLVPVPWRLLWFPIRAAEFAGVRLNFRSDSLVSLMNQNPQPDFSMNEQIGLHCRRFEPATIQL